MIGPLKRTYRLSIERGDLSSSHRLVAPDAPNIKINSAKTPTKPLKHLDTGGRSAQLLFGTAVGAFAMLLAANSRAAQAHWTEAGSPPTTAAGHIAAA
jgi:hypothetical protein